MCVRESNRQTHTYSHMHTEMEKPIDIGEMLLICLKTNGININSM